MINFILILALFFLLGFVFSYIIFPICDIIERLSYSIVFSITLGTISCFLLKIIDADNYITIALFFVLLSLIFYFVVFKNNKVSYKTIYNKDIWLILFLSTIGSLWRYFFKKLTENYGSAYSYAGARENGNIPDLGFYTGMVKDHANYFANGILKNFFDYFSLNFSFLEILIIVFIYLGFIYILFSLFRTNKTLTYSALIIFSLGPIEIFHSTMSFLGKPISYITFFSLFIFFKSKNKNFFWVAFLLCIYSAITYYTATIIVILTSLGFLIALLIQEYISKRRLFFSFKKIIINKKILSFLLFIIICTVYLTILSDMINFTIKSTKDLQGLKHFSYNLDNEDRVIKNGYEEYKDDETDDLKIVKKAIIESKIDTPEKKMLTSPAFYYHYTKYRDPYFFGLSAITWQTLFFILCGITFIFHIISKKEFSEENKLLVLCIIPITIISFAFIYKNYFTRAIDYVAFFGLLTLTLPKKKCYKFFLIFAIIFILITSFQIAKDRNLFLKNPQLEIKGAQESAKILEGKIFSDQKFINHLILSGYFKVTGANDNNPILIGLFYTTNKDLFIESIKSLGGRGIKYIATTERMRKKFILMLDYHKKKIITDKFFEENLEKIYDNGDVKIYNTNLNHHENESAN